MTKLYDWESNIKINIFMLRIFGLWPKGKDSYTFGLYTIHVTILMSVFLLGHIFFQAVNIYFIKNDLNAVTGTIYVLFVEFVVVFKVYYVITKMSVVKQLMGILDTDMFQPTNTDQKNEIDASVWFWRTIYKTFLYMCFGTNMFWVIYPLMDKSGVRRLPFLAWYPYDPTISPLYEITYVYQITSVGFITTVHVNIDALVAALNVFNGSQFDILCDNLRNLHKTDDDVNVKLVKCIHHHRQILNFAEKSNGLLNWILLVQFFVAGFAIGLSLYQLTLVVPFSSEFYSFASYAAAISVQSFMYCWFGNEVEIKSTNITYAAFECDWTEFSKDTLKNLLYFMLRSQKPVKLSALNLFFLSLDTFMKIMKTSWSYFALLHQVNLRK